MNHKSATTVTVASCLPFALTLQLSRKEDGFEPTPSGPRPTPISRKYGPKHVVAGHNPGKVRASDNFIVRPHYKLTEGIPKDFFDAWVEEHKDQDFIVNKLVFAHSVQVDLQAMIREQESGGRKSGLEPLNPDGDPRFARGPFSLEVSTADEMKGRAL